MSEAGPDSGDHTPDSKFENVPDQASRMNTQALPGIPGSASQETQELTSDTLVSVQAHSRVGYAPKPNDTLGGKYRLLRPLGEGGMGEVFVALHLSLKREVAVKLMRAHVMSNHEYVQRFTREARVMSQLNHQNIVSVLDYGEGPTPFIVMEYVTGQTMEEWLSKLEGPPPLSEVCELVCQLCDALQAAHERGVVHRDLKPDNVLLGFDAQGRRIAKVLDFGLAHVEETDARLTLTRGNAVAGTPYYMSPEQCRSMRVGPASDLYALGCILTELLQLEPPFPGTVAAEVVSSQMYVPPGPLVRTGSQEIVPAGLEALRLQLLEKQPHARPASAAAVRELLRQAFDPEAERVNHPARKEDVPDGGRASRSSWQREHSSMPPPAGTPPTVVQYFCAGPRGRGLTANLAIGLHAQAIAVSEVAVVQEEHMPCVVMVEGGSNLQETLDVISDLKKSHPGAAVLAAAQVLTTEVMTKLIECGADDVVSRNADVSKIAKKLRRLGRRISS